MTDATPNNLVITGMRTAGKKQVPKDTEAQIFNPGNGEVHAKVRLPGAKSFKDFGKVDIVNGEIVLPVYRVFLCHAKEDASKVARLSKKLWEDGYVSWFDKEDLLGGDDWKGRIRRAIKDCDYFIACPSKTSCTKTGFVQKEIRLALEEKDLLPEGTTYIVPLLLEKCDPPESLGDFQWVHGYRKGWYNSLNAALRQVRRQ